VAKEKKIPEHLGFSRKVQSTEKVEKVEGNLRSGTKKKEEKMGPAGTD